MNINPKTWKSSIVIVGSIVGLVLMSAMGSLAWAGNPNSGVMPPHAYPFGKSYGKWSANWWKWHFKLPATDHPALSFDGANCDAGQKGKVWFLTGAFDNEFPGSPNTNIVIRELSIPE